MSAPSASTRLPIPSHADAAGGASCDSQSSVPGIALTATAASCLPTPVVGIGTLRRLSELDSRGHRVLSIYLELDAADGRPPAVPAGAIEAVIHEADDARLPDAQREFERVRKLRATLPRFARGTRSVAVFSSAGAAIWEVVALPCAVPSMAVLDTIAWLEPLTGAIVSGNWGVAVLGSRTLRLLRGDSRALVEFANLDEHGCYRRPTGDRPRPEIGLIESSPDERVWRAAELLRRAHRRRAFEHLVIAAPCELWTLIERELDDDVRERLAGLLELDGVQGSAQDLARAAAAVVARVEREEHDRYACSTSTGSIRCERVEAQSTTGRYLERVSRTTSTEPATARGAPDGAQCARRAAAGVGAAW